MTNPATLIETKSENSQTRVIGIASIIWAGSIFLSRVMGLLREQIIGRTLGASRTADLYFASFTLPDFLNYLLAAGALSIVFIPIFLAHLKRGDPDRGWDSFSVIANFILVVGIICIGLLMIFARPLAVLVAPGFTNGSDIDTLVRLTRIILPAQFFHVVGGLLSAVLRRKICMLFRQWLRWFIRLVSLLAASLGLNTPNLAPRALRGECWLVPSWVRLDCHSTAASRFRCAGCHD